MGLKMLTDDQRSAANISVTLSGQLIAASLGMLAIEGAVLTFAFSYRETRIWFTVLIIFAALFFISSIFKAGKGITDVRNKVYAGSWRPIDSKSFFNSQAILCIVGLLIFFSSSFFVGPSKENQATNSISNEISGLKSEIHKLKEDIAKLSTTNIDYCKNNKKRSKKSNINIKQKALSADNSG